MSASVSNHRRLECLLNHLFMSRSKKTSKLLIAGLWKGNPLVPGGFPSQRPNDAENVPIWWRHNKSRYFLQHKWWIYNWLYILKVFKCVCIPQNRNTEMSRYNTVANFLPNPHIKHPIARPWGRDMGCLSWVQMVIHFLSQSLRYCMQSNAILHRRIITTNNCLITYCTCYPSAVIRKMYSFHIMSRTKISYW